MWGFLSYYLRSPMRIIKNLLTKNPLALFVFGILTKWYILIASASIIVTYLVFSGLQETGVLQEMWVTVSKGLNSTKAVAQHCPKKIRDFDAFINCMMNPPAYKPTGEIKKFEDTTKELQEKFKDHNPYSSDPAKQEDEGSDKENPYEQENDGSSGQGQRFGPPANRSNGPPPNRGN